MKFKKQLMVAMMTTFPWFANAASTCEILVNKMNTLNEDEMKAVNFWAPTIFGEGEAIIKSLGYTTKIVHFQRDDHPDYTGQRVYWETPDSAAKSFQEGQFGISPYSNYSWHLPTDSCESGIILMTNTGASEVKSTTVCSAYDAQVEFVKLLRQLPACY